MLPLVGILRAEGGPLAGRSFVVDRSPFHIGRSADSNLVVSDTPVSRRHASLELQGGRWFLRDLGSSNGTFLNRQAIDDSPQPLHDGDLVGIGDSVFLFTTQAPQVAGAQAHRPLAATSQQRRLGWVVAAAIVVLLIVLAIAAVLLFGGPAGKEEKAGSTPGLLLTGVPTGLSSALPAIQMTAGLPTGQVPLLTDIPTELAIPSVEIPLSTGLPAIPLLTP